MCDITVTDVFVCIRMATISSKRVVAKDADGQDNIAAFYASDEDEQDGIEATSRGQYMVQVVSAWRSSCACIQ